MMGKILGFFFLVLKTMLLSPVKLLQIILQTWFGVVQWLTGLILCLISSWKATIVILIFMPFRAIINSFGNSWIDRLVRQHDLKNVAVSAKAKEILSSYRTIRSFDAEMREYHIYKEKLQAVHDINSKTAMIVGVKDSIQSILQWVMVAIILYITGKEVVSNKIGVADIVVITNAINFLSFAFQMLFGNAADLKKASVSTAKILEIIDREPKIKIEKGQTVSHVRGKIEFRNVCFRYPSREEFALNGLVFTIEPGRQSLLLERVDVENQQLCF